MTLYAISLPGGSDRRAECGSIKEARIEAFNLLQMMSCGFSARIRRVSTRGRVDMGSVCDDGLWTRDDPPDGEQFFDPVSAMGARWRQICTASPIMFSDADSAWYFDAELFTRESVRARLPRVMQGECGRVEISEIRLRPTFSDESELCWEASESERSHRFWEVIVDGTA